MPSIRDSDISSRTSNSESDVIGNFPFLTPSAFIDLISLPNIDPLIRPDQTNPLDQITDSMIRTRFSDYRVKYGCCSEHIIANHHTMAIITSIFARSHPNAEWVYKPYDQVPIFKEQYPDGEFLLV